MIKVGILTLSDKGSKGEREDLSGKTLKDLCQSQGWDVIKYTILPDEKNQIIKTLKKHFDPDNIVNPGGTLGLD